MMKIWRNKYLMPRMQKDINHPGFLSEGRDVPAYIDLNTLVDMKLDISKPQWRNQVNKAFKTYLKVLAYFSVRVASPEQRQVVQLRLYVNILIFFSSSS